MDLLTPAAMRAAARRSFDVLSDGLGEPVRTFAYPYGNHDETTVEAVRAAGYEAACTVSDLIATTDSPTFSVPRLTITDRVHPGILQRRLTRRDGLIHHGAAWARQPVSRFVRRHG